MTIYEIIPALMPDEDQSLQIGIAYLRFDIPKREKLKFTLAKIDDQADDGVELLDCALFPYRKGRIRDKEPAYAETEIIHGSRSIEMNYEMREMYSQSVKFETAIAILFNSSHRIVSSSITLKCAVDGTMDQLTWIETIDRGHLQIGTQIFGLFWAARRGWTRGLERLLSESKRGINQKDHYGYTLLNHAATGGQLTTVNFLLQKDGFSIDSEDLMGWTPLINAACLGYHEIVAKLLVKGAKWDHKANSGCTALLMAVQNGYPIVVNLLLEHERKVTGANFAVGQANTFGESPISYAVGRKNKAIFKLLVDAGLKMPKNDKGSSRLAFKESFLKKTAQEGWTAFFELLLETCPVDDPELEYCSPLCIAAEFGRFKIVKLLLEAGADRNSTMEHETALYKAVKNSHEGVVKLLLDAGADVMDLYADFASNNCAIRDMIHFAQKEGKIAQDILDGLHPHIDELFTATLFSFTLHHGSMTYRSDEFPVNLMVNYPKHLLGENDGDFFWVHLPANNMRWVELLISKLRDHSAQALKVLSPDRWVRMQHQGAKDQPHSRFMRPFCQGFTAASKAPRGPRRNAADPKLRTDSFGSTRHSILRDPDITLFVSFNLTYYRTQVLTKLHIPFLHWDMQSLRAKREDARKGEFDHEWSPTEKLVHHYLNTESRSLHVRRTLDQYYYHRLDDTTERDKTQAIARYQERAHLKPNVITMVDQLWLWVLRSVNNGKDTIITCFPTVCDPQPDPHPDPSGRTDVLQSITRCLSDERFSIQCANDLAGVIAAKCSRIYLNSGSTLEIGEGQKSVPFSEVYEAAIGNKMEQEAVSFQKFACQPPDDLANISKEKLSLGEIKDVLDELNIIASNVEQDHSRIPLYDSSDEIEQTELETETPVEMGSKESQADFHSLFRDQINFDAKPLERRASGSCRQRNSAIWGGQGDINTSLPLAIVNESISDIKGMIERAEKTYQALSLLIDLKLKHNAVLDSRRLLESTKTTAKLTERSTYLAMKAEHQGRTIMAFTAVTIIFLPLSFLSTVFQLNIRQFKKDEDGQLDLGYVLGILFPVSLAVSTMLIWVAFKSHWFGNEVDLGEKKAVNASDC